MEFAIEHLGWYPLNCYGSFHVFILIMLNGQTSIDIDQWGYIAPDLSGQVVCFVIPTN
jgi:hypothetical protein